MPAVHCMPARRAWHTAALAAALAFAASPGAARGPAFDLPAGPLVEQLAALAARAGITLQADGTLPQDLAGRPVTGAATAAQALQQLLRGTGWVAEEVSPGLFALRRAAPPLPGPEATVQPEVRVAARRDADGAAGTVPTDAAAPAPSATRMPGPPLAVPQALSTIDRDTLGTLGATRLDQVIDYVPGVSRQNDFGGTWDNIALRGFAGHEDTGMSLLRNGMQANRGFNAPRDTANVERFEFLRGPVAALYGFSEPGGTLDSVTRAAPWEPVRAAEWTLSQHRGRRGVLELGGPFGASSDTGADAQPPRLAWGLIAVAEDRGSFREHVRTRREMLAPTFTWKPAPGTTLRYDGEWLRQRAPLDRGVVAIGGVPGTVPDTRFFGEPGDGDLAMVNQTHQWLLSHDLSPAWQLHAGAMARRGTMRGFTTYGHGYGEALADLDATGWLWRQRRWRDFVSTDLSAQADLRGQFTDGGGRAHALLLGAEAFTFDMDQLLLRNPESGWRDYGIDVRNPAYRSVLPATTDTLQSTRERQSGRGLYLQDQVTLAPRWRLLLGVRHDSFRQAVDNRVAATAQRQSQSAWSPRGGITWLPRPGWAVYASAGASLRPNIGVDAAGASFRPERGSAREVGVKWQPEQGRLSAALALFDIAKRNVLVIDPQHTDHSLAAGRVRSRGLEAELSGRLSASWRIVAGAAWLRESLPQFPRASGSVLLVREWALDEGGGASAGLGLTHVGERTGDAGSPRLPAYTTARLVAQWQAARGWRLSLQVDNLLDRRYYASAYHTVWITPGAPRSASVTLRHTF
ncbi:TonB-dependent siderophore receptor [Acidovorax sp. GBBC 3334]|uniref:TonB-dependent siderophore receptor n=1 Tax=Acidovorax sp. GBBC 3334 TaxID=2940496 RepID=UPI00230293E4|nr:TonB-dependent siderophore receptor [Acidovorax sp. GBBC 3334]MDA8454401.1 TonB-dependent siderophore receptor [Acidovorax sp. GBBC 3334]